MRIHKHRRGPGRDQGKGGQGADRWLFGTHPVLAALANPDRECRRLLLTEDVQARLGARLAAVLDRRPTRIELDLVDRQFIDGLLRGAVHQGIALEVGPLAEHFLEDIIARTDGRELALVVVLDQVTDPHNVGAIMRSAAAFGADGVVTTERHAPGDTATLAKAASGALDLVPLVRVVNLARALGDLKAADYWCVGLDSGAERAIDSMGDIKRCVLVLGAEGTGLRRLTRETCDHLARIPMADPKLRGAGLDSLNVSTAAAVALYALSAARRLHDR